LPLLPGLSYARLRKPARLDRPEAAASPAVQPDRAGSHPRLLFWLTVALLAIGVLARVTRYAVMGAMWGDECMLGMNILSRDFAGLTRMLDHMQTAPILFLWSERVMYLAFGSSELALRFLPLAAGLGAFFLFWDFARRATSPLAAMLAMGLLAVSRWPVCMAATFKPYATDLFFATLLMNLAHRWRTEPGKLWSLVALVAVIPVVMSGSYTAAFVAGGVSLYLLPTAWGHSDRRARGLFVAFNVLMLGTFAANYWLHIHGQLAEQGRALETFMKDYWADGFPPASPIAFLKWAALINTGRLFAYPVGDANGGSVVTLLVFLVGVGVVWRSKSRSILVLCLAPFALNFLAAVMGKYPYGGCCRLSQHLTPAICLILGIALAAIIDRFATSSRTWVRNVVTTSVVFAGIGVFQMMLDLASPNRDAISAWSRQLHRELRRQMQPDDRVVLASPRVYMDETTSWQLHRLGDSLDWGVPADGAAEAPRVWILSYVASGTNYRFEEDALAKLGPGRVEVGRMMYSIPIDRNLHRNWQFTMICLAKPEHATVRPVFSSSP